MSTREACAAFRADDVAVIGIGCWYPGARNARELWENILGRRRQFRRMPDVRLPISQYHDDDRKVPDKTYGTRAAVIDGYAFDWAARRIPKQAYESTDIAHWLALDVTLQMLEDAGYAPADLPRGTTQVVVGNTLTGEFTRSNTLRGRWPFVRKMLAASAAELGLPGTTADALSQAMEHNFKSVFAPTNEDTLAGGLANTIAGRICNYLNVHGGGYVVDGACSSSLIAIHAAASSLIDGACDFAIAGGVDISLDPFELIGFAKTGALTPGDMAVYDKRGNGFIPGEGCGFVALKRLSEALRDGDRVYAVLDGWGMSSDGKGGITAPSVEGQSLALRRAYARAGIDPSELDFIEGHGTGTAVGDRTELLGIARALRHGSAGDGAGRRRCGVTSLKSIIGHTKAAAGVGAFIKAALAVNQRVIPPTAGCELPHEAFARDADCLYPVQRGRVADGSAPLRAGVSAMGFGGINVHVTMKSGPQRLPGLGPAVGERAAMASHQASEVFALAAHDVDALCASVRRLQALAADASVCELADLACATSREADPAAPFRAALVAASPSELVRKAGRVLDRLAGPQADDPLWLDVEQQIAVGRVGRPSRLGFVFPGQGSQRLGMARALVERFSWAAERVAQADRWAREAGTPGLADSFDADLDRHVAKDDLEPVLARLQSTQIAQPAIVLSSLLWLGFLKRLGLDADAVLGHSLGELTAFHAAGAFDEKTLIQLATLRGQLMAADDGSAGAMGSLACSSAVTERLAAQVRDRGVLVVANINSAGQTVVSGDAAAVDALLERAQHEGVRAQRLPVANAFHSPLVAPAAAALRERARLPDTPLRLDTTLISSCDGRRIPADVPLREHFASQITLPVDFVAAAQRLREHCDVALEVGPGAVLSNLLSPPDGSGVPTLPVERQAESWHELNWLVAVLHARGRPIAWATLYENRIIRPFVPASEQRFIMNPCERPLPPARAPAPTSHVIEAHASPATGDRVELAATLARYLAQRGDFIADVIKADLRANGLAFGHPGAANEAATGAATTGAASGRAHAAPTGDLPTRPAPAPRAAPEPTNAADPGADTRELVLRLAAQVTGFPPDRITLGMHLLDDLNLDSIKAGALVAEACMTAGVAGALDATAAGDLTLAALAERIDAERPRVPAVAHTSAPSAAALPATSPSSPLPLVIELASRYTGFAVDTIQPGYSFVDDLNLDSIKFAALVSEAAATLGLEGRIAAADVAPGTLEALAAQLQDCIRPAAAAAPKAGAAPADDDTAGADWARSYVVRLVPSPPPAADALDLTGCVVAIQCDAAEREVAQALARAVEGRGATVLAVDAEGLLAETRRDIDHFILVQPRSAAAAADPAAGLAHAVRRLHAAAVVSARQRAAKSWTCVQFGGLGDGIVPLAANPTACASSFAASVHLERPALRVRVVDFAGDPAPDRVARLTLDELGGSQAHVLCLYDAAGTRHTPRSERIEPASLPPRDIRWDASDVVLVTGGAKGITAECAFAFARKTGARMVLVGSSPHGARTRASTEIASTLERFEDAGLSASYVQCDIADPAAVHALVQQVEQALGPITGVIHGAGMNKPRRVEQCSEDDARQEVAPKLLGILHLCAALDRKPPKLVVALSSIIGVTGMAGNAWYAYSNEALNLCLQRFAAAHPATQTIALAYSVWAEVGMGAKLGSTRHLARMGVSAIAPSQGVAHFMHHALRTSPAGQVVVAGRLAGLDTWAAAAPPAQPAGRFIDDVRVFEPGVELVNRVRLGLDDDLYLRDHFYRGVYLFPTVFGLEAMAQSVALLLGLERFESLRLENIELQRPIVVSSEAGALIEIRALAAERAGASDPLRVQVGIRTQHTGFRVDHFAATFVLEPQDGRGAMAARERPAEPTDIDPQAELYGGLLFQGALFRRMRTIWAMDSKGSSIDIARRADDACFASRHPRRLWLGDPALRDVLLQSPQLSEKGTYLPVHIDTLRLYTLDTPAEGSARATNRIMSPFGEELVCDVVAHAEDGRPIEQLTGYRLKRMEYDPRSASPEDFVDPQRRDAELLREALAQACATLEVSVPRHLLIHRPGLSRMARGVRRLAELPVFAEVAGAFGPERLEVHWQDDGRPVLRGLAVDDIDVSLSHDDRHCLCVAGTGAQGCDIEPIAPRSESQWAGLLGERRMPLLRELTAAGDPLDQAGTRLWCAIESAKKALGGDVEALRIGRRDGAAALLLCTVGARTLQVLTIAMSLTRLPRKVVAMVVASAQTAQSAQPAQPAQPAHVPARPVRQAESPGAPAGAASPGGLLDAPADACAIARGPQAQPKPCFRFRATFKDTTTLRNTLDLPIYADWMGDIRELAIANAASQLVPDFASGRWGMVTNESEIRVLADAHCLDLIEGRMYISRAYGKFDSSIDMHFEWLRIGPDGVPEPIATSTMATTWVEIKGHGVVEVQPFPPYLQAFVSANLPGGAGAGGTAEAAWPPEVAAAWARIAAPGSVLYEAPNAPKVEPELARRTFATSLAESNLVGNIYFANYYRWQKRLIDGFLHPLAPGLYTAAGRQGEFHWRHSAIRHLREAMPFDSIEVVMALKRLSGDGLCLHFDFYRCTGAAERVKLAYGECEAVWVAGGAELPSPMPQAYRAALVAAIHKEVSA